MKINNKKAIIHWDAAIYSSLVAIGMIIFSIALIPDIPKVGQYSISMVQAFEKNSNIPIIIDTLMKQIAKNSITSLSSDIFQLSGCRNYLSYTLLNGENGEVCVNKNLEDDFKATFEEKYIQFQLEKFKNFDLEFSNVNYKFLVEEDNGKFFIKGIAGNKLEVPINLIEEKGRTGKRIGNISINPSFKIPINYDFDEYKKLIENIEELIEKCKDEENAEKCINSNKDVFDEDDEDSLELMETCETEEKEKFLKFTEYFESCARSDGTNCECKGKPEGSFSIKQVDTNAEISGKITKEEFKETLENIDLKESNLRSIKPETFLIKDEYGKMLASKDGKKDACSREKSKFRFCIKSNKNKFYYYDEKAKKMVLKDVVYKFALQFGE